MFYLCAVEQKIINIIEQASSVFMRLGIKSVTMDDVARELGISKKTLYQYFDDKNDLIKKAFRNDLEKDICSFNEISGRVKNAIEELFEVNMVMRARMANMHPSIIFDLQKYHPEAWKMFGEFKTKQIYSSVMKNFERGVAEGFYNGELNADVIVRIYVSKIETVFDHLLFPPDKYNIGDVHRELILYHIRSIASAKGLKYLEKKLANK